MNKVRHGSREKKWGPKLTLQQYWKNKSVLVTGCSGFLGSWLTEELLGRGAQVIGLADEWASESRFMTSRLDVIIPTINGKVENISLVEKTLKDHRIDTVFHLAARAIVGDGLEDPALTFESNIRGTWSVLEASRRVGTVRRIVSASSDKAYGIHDQLPYREDFSLQGEHPYDVSKSCADLICRTYHVSYQLPVCVTRCGNFYGGGDLHFSRIVPGTIRSVLLGEAPVIRSDGSYVRDYIYIKDVVFAYMHLAEQMDRADVTGEAFNFGAESKVTVYELVQKILLLMDRQDLQPVVENRAQYEIKEQHLSARKAREILGWKAQYGLDRALEETISWYRDLFAKEDLKQPKQAQL